MIVVKNMHANRLRELRLEYGYTMEEVGKRIGIKKSSYASYESKYRQPPIEKLKSLSYLYGVSVDYILGLTNERSKEDPLRSQLKVLCERKGLHWDGFEIPEEVYLILENILEEAVKRQNEHVSELEQA